MATFANKIDGNDIYAKRAECDKDGIEIKQPFYFPYGNDNVTFEDVEKAYEEGREVYIQDTVDTSLYNGFAFGKFDIRYTISVNGMTGNVIQFSYINPRNKLVVLSICDINVMKWGRSEIDIKNETPTSPIITADTFYNKTDKTFFARVGSNWESCHYASNPSATAQEIISNLITKIDNVLSVGLLPVIKFSKWKSTTTDSGYIGEVYAHLVERKCCGYVFEIGDRLIFIGSVTYANKNYYTMFTYTDNPVDS